MSALRSAALNLAGLVPAPIKAWIYDQPALLKPLAGILKRIVPSDGETVVTVTAGPNKGTRLVVDRSVPNYFWLNPDYEPEVQRALADFLRPGMVAADIGAHMGFDTIHMARLVGPLGHVHAFEPDPANARKLSRNRELNSLHQITCHASAVSEKTGTLSFSASGNTTSHIAGATEPDTITVPSVTLDEVMRRVHPPRLHLVKVDVEGAEFDVLQGAKFTLRELRPVWIIEIHSAQTLTDCGRLLLASGYRIESLTAGPYYANAISCLNRGDAPPLAGFDVGHIRAVPADHVQT